MRTLIIAFPLFISNLVCAQYITGLSVTQNGENQIKTNLKVYLPNWGEFDSYTTNVEQNTITLSVCYYMSGATVITNLENDFYIDIPENGTYTLIANIYLLGETSCDYENLEDTASLSFTTPIEGTISLGSNELGSFGKSVELYPNPVKDILNIRTDLKIKQVNVYDSSGKLTLIKNENFSTINTSGFENGIYYLKILTDDKTIFKKFIIKN